jgi:hypothetical protein
METKIEKELRFLKAYAVIATVLCGLFVASAFTLQSRKQKFDEIDVERINIVEKDGKLKLVISNKEKLPDPIIAGKTLPRDSKSAGLLFYNAEGDESGGLIFDGQKKDGKLNAFNSLTFDQYQQDQTLQLVYDDSPGYRLVGLRIKDRPDIPQPEQAKRLEEASRMKDGAEKVAAMKPLLSPDRLFVGKSNGNAAVWLFDREGQPRIKIGVDSAGNPKLQFLDATGKVISSLPDSSNPTRQ